MRRSMDSTKATPSATFPEDPRFPRETEEDGSMPPAQPWQTLKPDMTLSRYNWCLKEGRDLLLYNGFTGSLAKVFDPAKKKLLEQLLSEELYPSSLEVLDPGMHASLSNMGVLIPQSFDERDYLRILTESGKYGRRMAITAVMTTRCNFDCSYCYETRKNTHPVSMSRETVLSVIALCKQLGTDSTYVTLYGGEPLLNKEMCFFLLEGLNDIPEMKVSAQIITNGYYLNDQTAMELAARGVLSAQVTLDGPPERHNASRPLRGGGNTYDTVVQNVTAASRHMKISLRVNISGNTGDDYLHAKYLFEENSSVRVYPAIIRDYSEKACSTPDCDILSECVGMKNISHFNLGVRAPGCVATNMTGIVIFPEGQIAKCWREVASSESCCYPTPYGMDFRSMVMAQSKWDSFNPYVPSSTCYNCKLLPACGGGCPYHHVNQNISKCLFSVPMYEDLIRQKFLAQR